MKARSIIGGIIAFAGIFMAVCTIDGTENEVAIRLIGTAMFAVGSFMGRFIDGMDTPETEPKGNDDGGYSKTDDHNPYPQE